VPVVGVTADLGRVLTELRPEELVLSKLPPDDEIEAYRAAAEAAGVRLLVSPYARAFVPL
jgi:hypothetical protein